ncbi:magnesium transporter [Devosia sp. 17-2-E-8]|nr:magnesium transporter [Devosia sp. 17-2-E-8]
MNLTLLNRAGARNPSSVLDGFNAADSVEFLNGRPSAEVVSILGHLPLPRAAEILSQPELERAPDLLSALPDAKAPRLLAALADDRAADIVGGMNVAHRAAILRRLAPPARAAIEKLLAYPEGTAGAIMTAAFIAVPETATVGETLALVRRGDGRQAVYAVAILDAAGGRLLRMATLRGLISAAPDDSVLAAAPDADPVSVAPLTPREDVARLIRRHDLLALPVVDADRHVLGLVAVDDVIDALIAEQTEDVHKFGGMGALGQPYSRVGFLPMIGKRAGWLSVLFLSEMLTASAMQHYSDELEKAVVLTLFIPLIMSSGGNSGSQATSLLVRSLALGEVRLRDWWRVALREMPTGIVLGAILGCIGVLRIAVWQYAGLFDYGPHWELIALTVAAALVGIVTFGSLAGSMLPFALKALRFDPANASAPFVATLVDVTGLVIYFSIATLILRGTVL